MDQLHVRLGGDTGGRRRRVLEKRISGVYRKQDRGWAIAVLVGGWCEVARGVIDERDGRVYTDADDRWCWLRCLGQWTSRVVVVGGGGRLQTVDSSPANGLGREKYIRERQRAHVIRGTLS
jgi:hypothetical protein